jgi:FixJ family two-component response regulator
VATKLDGFFSQEETVNGNLADAGNARIPTVFVVDDDEDVRDSLGQLLRSVGIRANVFAHGEALIEALAGSRADPGPACIVLDVRLRGLSGLMVQQELARRGITHPVIFITGHGDIVMTVKAMKAGAVDFLTKPLRDQDLLDAIAEAVEQDRLRLADACAFGDLRGRWIELTPRQKQVMQRIACGVPSGQIADELGVSEITVKIYRGESMKRLGVKTLAEFLQKARLLGLASADSPGPLQV